MDIKKIIMKKRNISDSTLRAYISNLNKIAKEVYNQKFNITMLENYSKNIKYLKKLTIHTRKNIVAAIVVACKSVECSPTLITKYEEYMKKLIDEVSNNYSKNKKSDKDKKNWVSYKEIIDKIKFIMNKIKSINLDKIKRKDIDLYQQLVILALYTLMPPQRNNFSNTIVCFTNQECNELDEVNYLNLSSKELILVKYKTVKKYGKKIIKIPDNVIKIIKMWMKINPTKYLLINTTNKTPMTSNGITKYLNKIFKPKKVSTTIIRKLYLTNKYPIISSFEDMIKDAHDMGHSIETQQKIYRKKD